MKLLVLLITLLLTSCVLEVTPHNDYTTVPETTKHELHKVGECFEFIRASKDSWGQPQVIIKVLKVGIESYLVQVVENPRQHRDLVISYFQIEDKKPISCH